MDANLYHVGYNLSYICYFITMFALFATILGEHIKRRYFYGVPLGGMAAILHKPRLVVMMCGAYFFKEEVKCIFHAVFL